MNKDIKKGELILIRNYRKLKKYTPEEIFKNKKFKKKSDHSDHIGGNLYVLDFSPHSYSNHSCNPNSILKHTSKLVSKVYAKRIIKKGEEITHDYGKDSEYKKGDTNYWEMKCKCGEKNCRKIIRGRLH